MVPIAEIIFVLVVMALGTRWYLRTPLHRARKSSGVFPPQVHGHMGFGMYTPSNPPLLPHALHDLRNPSKDQPETDTDGAPRPRDA